MSHDILTIWIKGVSSKVPALSSLLILIRPSFPLLLFAVHLPLLQLWLHPSQFQFLSFSSAFLVHLCSSISIADSLLARLCLLLSPTGVDHSTSKLNIFNKNYKGLGTTEKERKQEETEIILFLDPLIFDTKIPRD